MAEKTIDELLNITQNAIRVSGNLETRDSFQNVSIATILNDINQLSKNINDSMEDNNVFTVALPQYYSVEQKLIFLRKLRYISKKKSFL